MSPPDAIGAFAPSSSLHKQAGFKDGARPSVSVVIVTYFTGDVLKECLYAALGDPWTDEVIVVNNGNPLSMTRWLSALCQRDRRVRLIHPSAHKGFAYAANMGARAAANELLVILNPDAVLKSGSLASLWNAGRDLTVPWIVGGKLFYPDGREQRGARRDVLTPWRALSSFLGFGRYEHVSPIFRDVHRDRDPQPDGPVPMPVISGALFMTPREAFADIGGFDEGYFLHVEDIDLCRRVGEIGGEVWYAPQAGAMHYGSTSDVPRWFVDSNKAKGLRRYFLKFAHNKRGLATAIMLSPLIAVMLHARSSAIRLGHAWRNLRDRLARG